VGGDAADAEARSERARDRNSELLHFCAETVALELFEHVRSGAKICRTSRHVRFTSQERVFIPGTQGIRYVQVKLLDTPLFLIVLCSETQQCLGS